MGQEIITGPGEFPPHAPPGFHWVVKQTGFSDTGGFTVWELVQDDPAVSGFISGLQSDFTAGMLAFLQSLNLGQIGAGGADKARHSVIFCGGSSPWKTSWTPTENWFITGVAAFAGCALSLNPGYANYAAIVGQFGTGSGLLPADVLLIITVSSGAVTSLGNIQVPVGKGTVVWCYGNVANAVQIFLEEPH